MFESYVAQQCACSIAALGSALYINIRRRDLVQLALNLTYYNCHYSYREYRDDLMSLCIPSS